MVEASECPRHLSSIKAKGDFIPVTHIFAVFSGFQDVPLFHMHINLGTIGVCVLNVSNVDGNPLNGWYFKNL